MPIFDTLGDLEKYLRENPEGVLEENIGEIIECECPFCKTVESIEIMSKNKGRCRKCNGEMEITLVIE